MAGLSEDEARAAIERLWAGFEPLVDERLEAIDRISAVLTEGGLPTQEEVSGARFAAHNLAGALGTYGRPEAGDIARAILHSLEDGVPSHADFAARVLALRKAIAHG